MNDQEKNIELFDQYLEGALVEKERDAFETKLAVDETFKAQFEAYQASMLMINSLGIRKEVGDLLDKRPGTNRQMWIGIAASVLIIFTFWMVLKSSDPYDSYFEPYPNVLATRNTVRAMSWSDYYTREEYQKASEMLQYEPPGDTINFYLGMCNLALKDFSNARETLALIKKDSPFNQQVSWYLIMTDVGEGKYAEATQKLKTIKPGAFKYQKAQELIDELMKKQ
ncbi:MAG: hypothetical protein AAGA66_19555 [Bacteroidota bacterium]